MDAKLVVVSGKQAGKEIPISRSEFLIGRGEQCRLQLKSHLISRKHCAILVEEGVVSIEDFGSTNGTLVNGEKIEHRHELNHGDHIKIGTLELEVRLAPGAESKKKPKVKSVREAAARTVASAAAADEDLDISSWLTEDDEGTPAASPPKKPATHDTSMGHTLNDTVSMEAAPGPPEKQNELAAKIVGKFPRSAKPKAESSRSAAEDMLKQFFHKKPS